MTKTTKAKASKRKLARPAPYTDDAGADAANEPRGWECFIPLTPLFGSGCHVETRMSARPRCVQREYRCDDPTERDLIGWLDFLPLEPLFPSDLR